MKDSDATENSPTVAVPKTSKEVVEQSEDTQSTSATYVENPKPEILTVTVQPRENEEAVGVNAEVQTSDTCAKPSTTNAPASEGLMDGLPVNDSKRKFRVWGLNFPGKWVENESFLDILRRSESFHLWFEKATEGKVKPGGASIVFESIAEAKNAFTEVQKIKIEGCSLKLQASKPFYEDAAAATLPQMNEKVPIPFDVEVPQSDTAYRLFAIHLPSSTKKDLLTSIFDAEYVQTIQLANDPFAPSELQAEIIFRSKEVADTASSELDELEIEGFNRMVLLRTDEYVAYMKKAAFENASMQARAIAPTPVSNATGAVSSAQLSVPYVPAPELGVDDVASFLQEHIDKTRLNWAEISGVAELWNLCDAVSRAHNGIPDSLLKLALLRVLGSHRNASSQEWMITRLDELIKMWKKEVQNTKSVPREGAVTMSAPTYIPPEVTKRKSKCNRKALETMMGVGALLNTARTVLAVEEGEVEVDEDEHGIFSIDGQELTFESWGNLCKASTAKEKQPQPRLDPMFKKMRDQYRKGIKQKKMEEKKERLMRESMKPLETEEEEEKIVVEKEQKENVVGPSVAETSETGKKRELEEGEMSSDSSSTSTSSASSTDEPRTARSRRRKQRRHKKHTGSSSQMSGIASTSQLPLIITQLYKQRHGLIKSLNPVQKHAFAVILNQIASSPQGVTSAQRNEMNVFMRNFAAAKLPSK